MKKIVFVCALFGLVSCTDSLELYDKPIEQNENVELADNQLLYVTVPDTAKSVDKDKASRIAEVLLKMGGISRMDKSIESVRTVDDKNGEPSMYIVNFANNGGYVVVSAKKSYYPIIAFSDEGSISGEYENTAAGFILNENMAATDNYDKFPDELKKEIASCWMDYNLEKKSLVDDASRAVYPSAGMPQVYYDSISRWNQDESVEIYTFADYKNTSEYQNLMESVKQEIVGYLNTVGHQGYGTIEKNTIVVRKKIDNSEKWHLLESTWHQKYPYNHFTPFKYELLGNVPLGCTTIAAGQIMRFHEYPPQYSWSEMPMSATGINDAVVAAKFLYELGKTSGIKYDEGDTRTDIDKVRNTFVKYNYSLNKIDHNIAKVEAELKKGFPVYMRGGTPGEEAGHAWVCDGYSFTDYITQIRFMTLEYTPVNEEPEYMIEAYRISGERYTTGKYFHMNWGWNDVAPGFYNDANIHVIVDNKDQTLSSERMDLIDIRPKNSKFN